MAGADVTFSAESKSRSEGCSSHSVQCLATSLCYAKGQAVRPSSLRRSLFGLSDHAIKVYFFWMCIFGHCPICFLGWMMSKVPKPCWSLGSRSLNILFLNVMLVWVSRLFSRFLCCSICCCFCCCRQYQCTWLPGNTWAWNGMYNWVTYSFSDIADGTSFCCVCRKRYVNPYDWTDSAQQAEEIKRMNEENNLSLTSRLTV